MASSIPHNTLGRPSGTTRVDDIQRVISGNRNTVGLDAPSLGAADEPGPVALTSSLIEAAPAELITLPDDDAVRLVMGEADGLADEFAVAGRGLCAVDAAGGGEDGAGAGGVYALGEGGDDELRMVLEKVNARRVIHAEHGEGLNSFEEEPLGGLVVRLVRGKLGLVPAGEKKHGAAR